MAVLSLRDAWIPTLAGGSRLAIRFARKFRMRSAPFIALLWVSVSLPSAAAAQLMVTFETAGRDAPFDYTNPPVGLAECMANSTVDLRVSGLDGTGTILDVWRVAGTVDCTPTEARIMDTRTCTPLTLAVDQTINSTTMQKDMPIELSEILDCTSGSATFNIWFLVANAMASVEPVMLSGSLQIQYDPDAPAAPTGLTDAAGDTMASTTWTQPTVMDIFEYIVYADTTSVATTCEESLATTQLVEGGELPPGMVELGRSTGSGLTIDPSQVTMDYGGTAAIAVVAVDRAGNVSVVSNIACASRIETTGFCDAYECGSGCSVSGAKKTGPSDFGAVFLAFAASTLALRRKKPRTRR
jgi:hypothetical protein